MFEIGPLLPFEILSRNMHVESTIYIAQKKIFPEFSMSFYIFFVIV